MHTWLTLLLVVHGLIHGLGFAKAFQLAHVPQLAQPIARPLGLAWLCVGLLVVVCAFLPTRMFWIAGTVALLASQLLIATAWSDARFGTLANVVLLAAVIYAFATAGPLSFVAEYRRDAQALLRETSAAAVITEADLASLPEPVQRYLRFTGSVGKPRVRVLHARWRGRMRAQASDPWMPIWAEQLNVLAPESARLFHMTARSKGLPVDIFHRFVGRTATFRVRLLSLFPLVDAHGRELARAETVTILNDMCLLAPTSLLGPAVRWHAVDARHANLTFERFDEIVGAALTFDDAGALINFVSDDRLRAAPDGKHFTTQRWSTPCDRYRDIAGRRVCAHAVARWHAPDETFDYADFELESIE